MGFSIFLRCILLRFSHRWSIEQCILLWDNTVGSFLFSFCVFSSYVRGSSGGFKRIARGTATVILLVMLLSTTLPHTVPYLFSWFYVLLI